VTVLWEPTSERQLAWAQATATLSESRLASSWEQQLALLMAGLLEWYLAMLWVPLLELQSVHSWEQQLALLMAGLLEWYLAMLWVSLLESQSVHSWE
jgi:hypothetical protein